MSSGGGKPKKKGGHEEHEEHVNHERWLVSYADMLTLLFVLFVVLFSMSSVDQKKFAELAAGLSEGFGAASVAFSGNVSNLDGAGEATQVVPIDPGVNPGSSGSSESETKEQQEAVKRAVQAESRAKASENAKAATKEAEALKAIENKLADALKSAKLLNQVKFTIDRRGLVVTVLTNEVVFAGNKADLQPGGKKILNALAPTLAKLPNYIEVDGNTNQLKVATTGPYPSGWELSAARASTTVRYLISKGMAKNRMSAVGFSDTKPLIDPKDPRAVNLNRRVDVVVLTQLPAEQAALLPAAAGDDAKLHTGQTTAEAKAEAAADTHD